MSALKEFADFVTLNKGRLAQTYAQLLPEGNVDFEAIPFESRLASGRKVLKAAANAIELQTPDPLIDLFNKIDGRKTLRWSENVDPGRPLVEIECLGQTLTPVVTNLEAGKFLWQILSEMRLNIASSGERSPASSLDLQAGDLPGAEPAIIVQPSQPDQKQLDEQVPEKLDHHARQVQAWTYKELVDNMPVGIFRSTLGPDGHFLEANLAMLTMFEAETKADLLQHSVSDLYRDSEYAAEFSQRIQEISFLEEEEVRFKTLKGKEFWGAVTAVMKTDADGRAYLDGMIEDITERKWVEKALRDSEEKYRTILENIEDGYYEVDLAGNLAFFNDSLCEILGYPANELIGMNNREYTDEKNARKLFLSFNNVYKTSKSAKGVEWEVVRKDGSRGYVETSASLIRDAEGSPTGFRGIARDITERKRIEQELMTSKDFLNKTIDAILDPIFVKDEQHRWIILNSAFCEFMGYSREELLGKSDYDFFPKEEADIFWEKDELVFASEVENVNEESFTDASGETHIISTKKSVFKDASGRKILVGTIRDITGVKAAEIVAQSRASREQTIRRITEKMRAASSLEELVKVTTEELGERLAADHAVLEMGIE